MIKKTFIVSLIALIGITVGIMNASAQDTVSSGIIQPSSGIITSIDPSAVPETNLRLGMQNPQVRKVQDILKFLGYFPSDIGTTEYLGPKTKEAITNFQRAQGLPATGFFGPATRQALKNTVNKPEIGKNISTSTIACMKIAVEKRENLLLSAYTIFADKIKLAREIRKTDLLNAWAQDSNSVQTAINQAWAKYKASVIAAEKEWKQSQRLAWTQVETERRNCKGPATGENQTLENIEIPE